MQQDRISSLILPMFEQSVLSEDDADRDGANGGLPNIQAVSEHQNRQYLSHSFEDVDLEGRDGCGRSPGLIEPVNAGAQQVPTSTLSLRESTIEKKLSKRKQESDDLPQ